MTTNDLREAQVHPANAVFALMDDREFRYSIVRPAVEKDKAGLSRLSTGKHQLKGFRNIAKAPSVMVVPVLSDEASLSADLARKLLEYWLDDHRALKERVAGKLNELGYDPQPTAFDDDGNASWRPMSRAHADLQYDGTFLPDEDKNAVMLMSLLCGWFGSDEPGEEESAEAKE